jgi:hypothetical protein
MSLFGQPWRQQALVGNLVSEVSTSRSPAARDAVLAVVFVGVVVVENLPGHRHTGCPNQ